MTGTTETPQALFRAAADLIALALAQLDLRRYPPQPGEQRGRFANFMHAKVHHRLEAFPRKLRESAEWLDVKENHRAATNAPATGAIEEESV